MKMTEEYLWEDVERKDRLLAECAEKLQKLTSQKYRIRLGALICGECGVPSPCEHDQDCSLYGAEYLLARIRQEVGE